MKNMFTKSLIAVLISICAAGAMAQEEEAKHAVKETPKGWHLLDPERDGYMGIGLARAYEFVRSLGLKSQPVTVAVIDSGIDTLHEDLRPVLWKNPGEIPGNGKDDDGNGYIDDVHGWNFIGGKDGRNVKQDSYEAARVYHALKPKFHGNLVDSASLEGEALEEYRTWLRAKAKVVGQSGTGSVDLAMLQRAYSSARKSDSILRRALQRDTFTGLDLDSFKPSDPAAKAAKSGLIYLFRANDMMETTNVDFVNGFREFLDGEVRKAESREKAPPDYRGEIVGDDESDINDRYYGNNDLMASTPFHGTHVAGIIGAVRNNQKGVDGVADNVRLMTIRAVPDGDEHDKDVALAIRYAVENGARIINMSFGKDFSPQKEWVDEAVRFAVSHNVLLVHAAGNDAKNLDSSHNYPTGLLKSGERAPNWITVGASADTSFGGLIAPFSNYGKTEVDVFAPGMRIYSTIPGGNTYGNAQGTSMASPVVAGTAAFLLSYFPYLTAEQLKYCIEQSVVVPTESVPLPGSGIPVALTDICKTGGIINAYNAAKIAAGLAPKEADSKKKESRKKSRS